MDKPTLRELTKFDPATYKRFITYLRQIYKIVPFCEIPNEDVSYLILRHDIDISLEPALKMAEIEHDVGIRSTYFVLLSSNHYNSFEGRNAAIIRQISGFGHEIGLHYDTEQYGYYAGNASQALKQELQALHNLVGKRICSVSAHAPRRPTSFLYVDSLINADDPRLRKTYVHDSQKIWTIKSLSALLNNPPRMAQLLVHPHFWMPGSRRKTKLDLALFDILLLLHRLRTVVVRVIHSRESCEN